jgi:hypothetical protein
VNRVLATKDEDAQRATVRSIERLCENSDQAILEHEKEVRITLGENKNTV